MTRLIMHLIGPIELLRDEEPLAGFESDKVRALLAYLAVESENPHRREFLAGLLWLEYPERYAEQTCTTLWQTCGESSGMEKQGHRFNKSPARPFSLNKRVIAAWTRPNLPV